MNELKADALEDSDMKPMKSIILAAMMLTVTACSQSSQVSRNEPMSTTLLAQTTQNAGVTFKVEDVRVSVPNSLVVSEKNIYYPTADIVWRGDPYGDRYEQVEAIFTAGMKHGAANLNGNRAVYVDIEVLRFHSLTERARYTVGGVHSIKFNMALRDVQTGALIGAPRLIKADLKAFGGRKAVEAEHKGLTQKIRIMSHLASVIQNEVAGVQTGVTVSNGSIVVPE